MSTLLLWLFLIMMCGFFLGENFLDPQQQKDWTFNWIVVGIFLMIFLFFVVFCTEFDYNNYKTILNLMWP